MRSKVLTYLVILLQVTYFGVSLAEDDGFSENKVFFLYYKSKSKGPPVKLLPNETIASKSNNKNCRIVFLLHGWLGSAITDQIQVMVSAYQEAENKRDECFEVLAIDYGKLALDNYHIVAQRIPKIAVILAQFIKNNVQQNRFSLSHVTIVGHSMGGHMGSFACEMIKKHLKKKCSILHGLELPVAGFPEHNRFEASSAECTTVIKTSDLSYNQSLGMKHYNFNLVYPLQPFYCKHKPDQLYLSGACAHSLAPRLFAKSVTAPTTFYVGKCSNFMTSRVGFGCYRYYKAFMGYYGCLAANGFYYVPVPHGLSLK